MVGGFERMRRDEGACVFAVGFMCSYGAYRLVVHFSWLSGNPEAKSKVLSLAADMVDGLS